MASSKKRDCAFCGVAHTLTKQNWFIYEGRSPICKVHEADRQRAKREAAKPKAKATRKRSSK